MSDEHRHPLRGIEGGQPLHDPIVTVQQLLGTSSEVGLEFGPAREGRQPGTDCGNEHPRRTRPGNLPSGSKPIDDHFAENLPGGGVSEPTDDRILSRIDQSESRGPESPPMWRS